MSSWWGGDDSGSDSDLYESDEEVKKKQPERPTRTYTLDESSSEDEGARKVKSKKESRFEDLRKALATIEAKRRNNDWIAIAEGPPAAPPRFCSFIFPLLSHFQLLHPLRAPVSVLVPARPAPSPHWPPSALLRSPSSHSLV